MLSILIPTYNTEVTTLVKQLLRQTQEMNFPSEIVVLDDASTNRSSIEANEMLKTMKGISYWISETNLGRTAARNLLAQKAQYDQLLFLDADVFPKYPNFLKRYSNYIEQLAPIVVGGIDYQKKIPEQDKILRYKYGKSRESKSVVQRKKDPHIIVSANILFHKEAFLKINSNNENQYGLDLLLSEKIRQLDMPVIHIDNPVFHLGLENSKVFLKKSKGALKTLVTLEMDKKIPSTAYPIQRAYNRLRKFKIVGIFKWGIEKFQKKILKNLQSSTPSIFLFNLYRLYYYAVLKEELHA